MNFLKIFKSEDFGFKILEKGHILWPFSGIAPSKIKILSQNLRVEYVYIIYIYICICMYCIYIGRLMGYYINVYPKKLMDSLSLFYEDPGSLINHK